MKKGLFILSLLLPVVCLAPAHAAGVKEGHVCDVGFVGDKVGDSSWVILDGRGGEEYEAGHIPGAVNYGKPVVVILKHPVDGRVVSVPETEKRLGEIGVDNNKGLIIYGTKGDYHVAVEQLPIYVGVKEFCFMDGGYEAWTGAGNKVDTGKVAPVPATFKANVTNPHFYMSTDEMITVVKDKKPGVSIIDTRSESEFNALENTILRGGRIPGAILIPHDKNLDENGKMLSKDKLAALYANIPKDNKVIVYCHRGCRTAFSYYALENMGYKDIVIYEDSYIVWGSRMDTPVENEHYINLRAYTKRIKALEDEAAK